ncbi:MAG: arginine decarboxylase, pyruvoyl-dependent [Lachnospiraceae bacterium]|nr:arginine decarboxylase, pyruvoyl-dependent [Lachnospiraceae bacterium]
MELKYYKIGSGVGVADQALVAFDSALIHAGISNYNLLRVSSILPPGAKEAAAIGLSEGSLLPTAYGTITSDIPGDRIASAVAIGFPCDKSKVGVIMEFEGHCSKEQAEETVRRMTMEAMRNHDIQMERIVVSGVDAVVENGCASCISAVAMWG